MKNKIKKCFNSYKILKIKFINYVLSCKKYLIDNYEEVTCIFLISFFATTLGVFLVFQIDNYRQEQIEKDIFRYKLIGLLFENSRNLVNIKDIRSGFTRTSTNLKQLNSSMALQILSDPLTFKYGGQGLMYSISVAVNDIDTFNKYSEFVTDRFKITRENTEDNLKLIYESLDQIEHRMRNLQKVLDIYNVKIFKTKARKETNFNEILDLLKDKVTN